VELNLTEKSSGSNWQITCGAQFTEKPKGVLINQKDIDPSEGWLNNPPKLKQSQINGEIQEVQITVVAQIYGEIQHTSGAKFTEKSKEYQNTVEAQKLQ